MSLIPGGNFLTKMKRKRRRERSKYIKEKDQLKGNGREVSAYSRKISNKAP